MEKPPTTATELMKLQERHARFFAKKFESLMKDYGDNIRMSINLPDLKRFKVIKDEEFYKDE